MASSLSARLKDTSSNVLLGVLSLIEKISDSDLIRITPELLSGLRGIPGAYELDWWNVEAEKNGENWESRDVYSGVESMSKVKKTKYLGDIIQNDGKK